MLSLGIIIHNAAEIPPTIVSVPKHWGADFANTAVRYMTAASRQYTADFASKNNPRYAPTVK